MNWRLPSSTSLWHATWMPHGALLRSWFWMCLPANTMQCFDRRCSWWVGEQLFIRFTRSLDSLFYVFVRMVVLESSPNVQCKQYEKHLWCLIAGCTSVSHLSMWNQRKGLPWRRKPRIWLERSLHNWSPELLSFLNVLWSLSRFLS